ncbi:MAG TPA: hypothetical protein VGF30_07180 [Bacteroidia bacterium]
MRIKIIVLNNLALIAYLVICIVLLPVYQYDIAPDAISYISIANDYAEGDFSNALNAYWSPLISWLLVPFILFKVSTVLAFKMVLILFGFLSYREFIQIIRNAILTFDSFIRSIIEWAVLPLFCFFALCNLTPDLLSIYFILRYFNLLLNKQAHENRWQAVKLGLVCALACFAKSYNLVFILPHFIIYSFIQFRKKEGRLSNSAITLGVIFNFFNCMDEYVKYKIWETHLQHQRSI